MMRKKQRMAISLLLFALLTGITGCSDNKSQDAAADPKASSQSKTDQAADVQSATPDAPPAQGGKCAVLLTEKCTACHSPARICEKLGKKSKARWQRTIERMTARGAHLNAEETAALLACLESDQKDLETACR